MSRSEKVNFNRSLRGFLGSTWLNRLSAVNGLVRKSPAQPTKPVEPIDAVFTTVSENAVPADSHHGFEPVIRQFLAQNVLDKLIQLQSEISALDNGGFENSTSHATDVYRHVYEDLSNDSFDPYHPAS